MAALIVVIICFIFPVVGECISFGWRACRRLSARERVLRAQREAARQVDDLFGEARIRMEEAAGRRSPGEHRISDGFGSWNRW